MGAASRHRTAPSRARKQELQNRSAHRTACKNQRETGYTKRHRTDGRHHRMGGSANRKACHAAGSSLAAVVGGASRGGCSGGSHAEARAGHGQREELAAGALPAVASRAGEKRVKRRHFKVVWSSVGMGSWGCPGLGAHAQLGFATPTGCSGVKRAPGAPDCALGGGSCIFLSRNVIPSVNLGRRAASLKRGRRRRRWKRWRGCRRQMRRQKQPRYHSRC